MSLLSLENIKKHYGAQEVLAGANLKIDPGEKVGIVGRNGGGKTTLFRLIEGLATPDWGRVVVRKGADLGYVPQRPEFDPGVTVREYVEGGMKRAREAVERLERIAEEMSGAEGAALERLMAEHGRLSERVEQLGGWEVERRIEMVMRGIGLVEALWEREARTLSGGEKSRTAMARALAGGHDLLLLDEPTNHLDLPGIEWIEQYIREAPGAVVVISHDRRLLQNAVEAIVELEGGQLVRYPGNYTKYVQLKEERYAADHKAWLQQQDLIRKEESFIKKHMGSQRTAEAKGRQRKLRNLVRLPRPYHDIRKPVIKAPEAKRGGELVLEAEGLAAGYGDRTIWQDVNLRVGRGERVGLVGRNGAGKSTLLRILAGIDAPCAGRANRGHGAVCGYYDQETGHFLAGSTPLAEIRRHWPTMTDGQIRSHLALFLFRGDEEIEKPVEALSGGERARLALAQLVLQKPSWLAMDEPTNHLDLAGRTALEEMLAAFDGALVLISHDRALLDDLCNRVVEIDDGGVREFAGNYSFWRSVKLEEAAAAQVQAQRKTADRKAKARQEAERQEMVKAQPKKRGGGGGGIRNPYKFKKLEQRIMALEEKLEGLNGQLTREEVYRDAARMKDVQIDIAEVELELSEANEEWENWI